MRCRTLTRALLLGTLLACPVHAAPEPPAADAPPLKAAPKTPPKASAPAPVGPRSAVVVPAPPPAPALPPRPSEREFHFVATVEATQTWKKNDPEHPGDQWSKGSTKQRYELTTRLRSDGKLEVRNLLDPDITARMEAKTIYLARQAKKMLEKPGQTFKLPKTEQEKTTFMQDMQLDLRSCNGEPTCRQDKELYYAAILAAMEYPEAMEEDTVPGRYLYFLPYKGCPESSRVTLTIAIDGARYNKDAEKIVPFSERHDADTVNASDGRTLCAHMAAVIDTQDSAKPMWQETVFVPRPEGMTVYTENDHTSREQQPQPVLTAVIDWMGHTLRHAPAGGEASATLPLALPLNQNATWLGLWTGSAHVHMRWSFKEVPATPASAPAK
ncbi:MAG: hypothetical protein ACT4PZ_15460 [Panacagrimonas sp.]